MTDRARNEDFAGKDQGPFLGALQKGFMIGARLSDDLMEADEMEFKRVLSILMCLPAYPGFERSLVPSGGEMWASPPLC